MVRITLEKFIEKAIKIHNNKYDYSKVDYINYKTKVIIICPKHGEFKQSPKDHLSGSGCKNCNKPDTSSIIEKFIKVHGNRYGYSLVNYINCRIPVKIICPYHGIFKQLVGSHLRGSGCKRCTKTGKLGIKTFIMRSKFIHGNYYDYSKVDYINNYTKVIIICKTHGEFLQTPDLHLRGRGCRKCLKDKNLSNNINNFLNKSRLIHGDYYDYSKLNYVNCRTKVSIICPKHGEFKQRSDIHLAGHGCPECAGNKRSNTKEFVERAIKEHGDYYDYSKVKYISNQIPVIIICPKHGEFKQIAINHLRGHGCKTCNNNSVSKVSQNWLDSLNISMNKREKIIRINGREFRVDGYDPVINTIYEFYGDIWHGNLKYFNKDDINPLNKISYGDLYNRTIEREKLLLADGYNLITIWESEWKEKNGKK